MAPREAGCDEAAVRGALGAAAMADAEVSDAVEGVTGSAGPALLRDR